MKKEYRMIIALLIVGVLLVIAYGLLSSRFQKLDQTNQNTNTDTNSQTSPLITVYPTQKDYYSNKSQWVLYPYTSIDPSKPLAQVQLQELTGQIPGGMTKVPLYSSEEYQSDKKYAPLLQNAAKIANNSLVISINPGDTITKVVALEKNTQSANFGWVNDDLILLIEKTESINNFYLVNIKSGQKAKIGTDEGVPGGINAAIGPVTYNASKKALIILVTNDGKYWQLTLTQS